jgi:hypothetical protein
MAIEELEKARQELELVLDQLRREQQEEILRGLESRFREMLTRQLVINQSTVELDGKGAAAWTHADALRLAGLAADQESLSGAAADALLILKEEGTTIVFPVIVEQIRHDMQAVAVRLRERKADAITQGIEADIVTALEDLIEAIKELRKKIESGEMMPGGGGAPDDPPLLPDSAELKLLRACQERVNRQTKRFNETRGEGQGINAESTSALERITDRQSEVAEMARKMNERVTGQ